MTVANESPRKYRSPLRQEQAQRTRAAILDAAGGLFVAKGYGATTMKDIAAAAEVSVESVYAQGSKGSLLLACVDRSIAGDDEESALLDREDMRELLESGDVPRKLAVLRAVTIARLPGSSPIFEAFRGAAALDPKLAEDWRTYEGRRHADCVRMVEGLSDHLRPDVTVAAAADVLWTLVSPSVILGLTGRGWTAEQFADWLVDSITRLLLDGP